MFKKIVAIEPLNLEAGARDKLASYAAESKFYEDMPNDNGEIIQRIGDADAVFLRHTTAIDSEVLHACKSIRYIGMCCSLYAPESANVDIVTAKSLGITVTGVNDYGDEGVPEYVISELVRFLHGFGGRMWKEQPQEIKGIHAGILGLGATGSLVASALRHFGAEVHYYSRTRKPDLEHSRGYIYQPLDEMLAHVEILCTCLTKNIILLNQREFDRFGRGKILINTSIAPAHDINALAAWLDKGNYVFSDTKNGIDPSGRLLTHANVFCTNQSSGFTAQAIKRLGVKTIENIDAYFEAL